jgi:hypothetical protein
MTRSRIQVVDAEGEARGMYERFYDKNPRRRTEFNFDWPTSVQEIGEARAEMYRSNKWQKNPKDFEDYKHIAESYQRCYVTPGFLRDYSTGKQMQTHGPTLEVKGPMPKHFTILAPLIGIQVRLYGPSGRKSRADDLYEIVVPRGMLAGAIHPETKETFLFVYTKAHGIGMLITGDELAVEKDGIVG